MSGTNQQGPVNLELGSEAPYHAKLYKCSGSAIVSKSGNALVKTPQPRFCSAATHPIVFIKHWLRTGRTHCRDRITPTPVVQSARSCPAARTALGDQEKDEDRLGACPSGRNRCIGSPRPFWHCLCLPVPRLRLIAQGPTELIMWSDQFRWLMSTRQQ